MSGLGSGVALAGLLVFVLGPLYWIAVTAFKSEGQIVMRTDDLWPTPWTLEQFSALFTNQPFGRWYLNTLLVSAASTVSHWSAPPWPATRWPGCGSAGRRASPSRCCSPT